MSAPLYDRPRLWSYVLVALASLLAGMALAQIGADRQEGASRIDWPDRRPPHPRTLSP